MRSAKESGACFVLYLSYGLISVRCPGIILCFQFNLIDSKKKNKK